MGVWDEAEQEKQRQVNQEEATEEMEKKIRRAAMEAHKEQTAAKRKAGGKSKTARELDDDYRDFTHDSEPYTVAAMSRGKIIGIFLAVLAVVAVAGYFIYGYVQKTQWIKQQVDTVAMQKARQSAYLMRLPAKTLQNNQVSEEGVQLYSAIYFPEQETLLATVDVAPDFEQMYCFLVDSAGHAYAGWYNQTVVQFDIAKVMFEQVPTGELVYLDCVDSRSAGEGYDPKAENPTRIRFTLNPLPPPVLPEEASGSSAGA